MYKTHIAVAFGRTKERNKLGLSSSRPKAYNTMYVIYSAFMLTGTQAFHAIASHRKQPPEIGTWRVVLQRSLNAAVVSSRSIVSAITTHKPTCSLKPTCSQTVTHTVTVWTIDVKRFVQGSPGSRVAIHLSRVTACVTVWLRETITNPCRNTAVYNRSYEEAD